MQNRQRRLHTEKINKNTNNNLFQRVGGGFVSQSDGELETYNVVREGRL